MHPGDGGTILPDTELYIIVNGKPTTSKVVWCSRVNVDHVNVGIREINWLYSFKKVMEITNNIVFLDSLAI